MAVTIVQGNKNVLDFHHPEAATFTASAYTVAAWYRKTTVGANEALWTKGTAFYGAPPRSCSFGLYVGNEGCRFAAGDFNGGSNEDDCGGGTCTADVWHHAAGTLGGGNMYAWYDGAQVATRGTSFTLTDGIASYSDSDNNAQFGGHFDDRFYYFEGQVAEAAFWSVQLSAGEVAALARGVSPWMIRLQSLVTYVPFIGPEQYDYAASKYGYRSWGADKYYANERQTGAVTVSLPSFHPPVGRLVA